MAVIGPYFALTSLLGGRKVYGVGSSNEEFGRSRQHQYTGSPQDAFVDRNEFPESILNMLRKARSKIAGINL